TEAGTSIKPARRLVAFIHFEENRACAETRKTAQMQIEQWPRQSLAAAGGGDGDREDLGFLEHAPGHDEPHKATPHLRPVRDAMAVEKQMCEFPSAPSPMERGGVKTRERAGVLRRGFRQRGLATCEK